MCEPLQQPLKGHKRIGELADGGTMLVTSFPRRIIALMLLKCVIFVYDIINLELVLVPFLCGFVQFCAALLSVFQ